MQSPNTLNKIKNQEKLLKLSKNSVERFRTPIKRTKKKGKIYSLKNWNFFYFN